MRRQNRRPPSYRLHKPTGQAVVRLDGHDHYLGKHGCPESQERYHRLIAEWIAQPLTNVAQGHSDVSTLTVNELILAYWGHATTYYVKNGKPTDEQHCLRGAFRPLRRLYGSQPVKSFGPLALKRVRDAMVDAQLARTVINGRISRIRRMFRWGVENELLDVSIYQALCSVRDLPKGRSSAREPAPIRPVSEKVVEQTVLHLPRVVADMVRFQQLTGARPAEICQLRPCDVEITDEIWAYRPESHKTEHLGRDRVIFIGPQAQDLLRPYLLRDKTVHCFSPADSEKERNQQRRERRSSPMTPSQAKRHSKRNRQRAPQDRYSTASYRRAITRACDWAWPAPKELDASQAKAWRKSHRWSPNQLRHSAATMIRHRFGLEASQAVLGHSSANVTQIYAERDLQLAARVMKDVG